MWTWQALISGLRPASRVAVLLVAALGSLLAVAPDAQAQTVRNFTARYSANVNGDIAHIGNSLVTCTTGFTMGEGNLCENTRPGTDATSLGSYGVNYTGGAGISLTAINVDPSAASLGLTNSSSADLNLASGSTILWAGMYWGANSANAQRGSILLRTPAMGGYTAVNATQIDASGNVYAAFADVTALVQAGGSGTYWGANLQANTGATPTVPGYFGGWALVIVYANNSLPLRNLVVYDGYALVQGTGTLGVNIPVSGFLTPYSGTVTTRVGTVGYDGDRGTTIYQGDTLQISSSTNPSPTTISDANNPGNNFYNSTISDLGTMVTSRNPAYNNNYGFELDRFNLATGIVGNGATSATLSLITNGEFYYPQVVTWATDIYVPIITPNVVKTLTDLNGGALTPGDTIRWNISMANTGIDAGTFLTVTDPIPANTTYVPGSLRVTATPVGSPVAPAVATYSDTVDADVAEYITSAPSCAPSAAPCVRFRLGHGANGTLGGTLNFGEATAVAFDTILNDGLSGRPAAPPAGTLITNTASISYSGQTIQTQFGTSSSAATGNVIGPPDIVKTFSPSSIPLNGTSTLSLVLTNPSTNPSNLNGVVIADTYPTGMINATPSNSSVVCTAGSTPGTLTGGVAGGNTIGMNPGATIAPNGSCTITVAVTHNSSVTGPTNLSNLTNPVTSANGGTGTSGAAVLGVAQLSIVKSFSPGAIQASANTVPGNVPPLGTTGTNTPTSTMSIAITNPNAVAVNQVTFSDTYPSGLLNAATPSVSFSGCGAATNVPAIPVNTTAATSGVIVRAANAVTIAAGATCTITVNVGSTVTTGAKIYNNQTSGAQYQGNTTAGNGSNVAQLTVIGAATIAKSFNPVSVTGAGISTLTIVVTNPNTTTTLTGGTLSDTYPVAPGAMTTAGSPNRTINCTSGSSATATSAAGSVSLSAVTLAPLGSCTLTISVTTAANGDYINTASASWANAPASVGSGTLNRSGLAVPTLAKTFTPSTIPVGGLSTMSFTISNSNGSAVTGASFSDTFPGATSMTFAATTITGTCTAGGFNGVTSSPSVTAFSVSGLTVPAGGSCTINVPGVTTTTVGSHLNSTSQVTTSNAGIGTAATASLIGVVPPVISKVFTPSTVALSTATVLSITVSNPAFNGSTLTGVTFTDSYPANLVNTATPGAVANCTAGSLLAGTITAAAGGTQVAVGGAGLTLAVGGQCVITVNVQTAVAGSYTNTIDTGAGTGAAGVRVTSTNGGTGNATSAVLTAGLIGISKAFSPVSITAGGTSLVTLTLSNSQAGAVSPISFTDTFPSGMVLASPVVGGTCTGVTTAPTAAAGASSISINAGSVPAAGSCTITFSVTTSVSGANLNFTTGVTGGGGTGATSGTAVLNVLPTPLISKSFAPSVIAQGGVATITFTILNPSSIAASAGALVDSYPAGMVNANPSNAATTCNGVPLTAAPTLTATAGAANLSATNLYLPSNGNCILTVRVTAAAAGPYVNTVPAGALTSTGGANNLPASATLTVLLPPTVSKVFVPPAVAANGASTLIISLTNPNTTPITGVGFTDTYPVVAGIYTNDTPDNGATTCAGGTVTSANAGASIALSGGTISPNSTCTVTVNIRASATAGSYNNTIGAGAVTTSNAGSNAAAANSSLSVARPFVSKVFTVNPVQPSGTSTLTFTITNPNAAPMTQVGLTDLLPTVPATMTVVTPASTAMCGGTLTTSNGPATIRLNNATVATSGTCVFSVAVAAGASAGSYVNVTNAVTSGATVGNTATDILRAMAAPTVVKSFSPATVGANVASVLTITLSNSNGFAITGGAFTDNYPANMTNTASPAGTTTCSGGSVSAANNGSLVALSGGTIPANGSCTVSVNVQASAAGIYLNSTGTITASNAPSGAAASSALTVLQPLRVSKSFLPTTVNAGVASVMTISLFNPNPTAGANVTGVALTDVYPSGMINTATPTPAIGGAGCAAAGTITGIANDNQLSYSGTVPANTTCTLTVNVTSNTGGVFLNSTGITTTGNAGSTASTSGTLVVNPPASTTAPVIATKTFTPSTIAAGGVSTLSISVFNPNSVAATSAATVFTDTYPTGITNTAAAGGTVTGAGCVVQSFTAAANGNSFAALGTGGTNFVIPAGGTCVYTRQVTASAMGLYTNSTGAITLAQPAGASGTQATAQLTVMAPPSISKSFTPSTVGAAVTATVMTLTLINPNGVPITGVDLTDAYPANLRTTATPNLVNGCAGTATSAALATSLTLTGGAIPASGSCTISVNVESTVNNVNITNTVATSGVTTTNAGSPIAPASATLSVGTATRPMSITKAFSTNPIAVGGQSDLVFSITKNSLAAQANMTFRDVFPAGMTLFDNTSAQAGGCGFTRTDLFGGAISAGDTGVIATLGAFAGAAAIGTVCTVTVRVTTSVPGAFNNSTTPITSSTHVGNNATATLIVTAPPTIAKSFSPSSVTIGQTTALTFTIQNRHTVEIDTLAFTDTMPAGMVIDSPSGAINNCNGTLTATPGTNVISLVNGLLGAGSLGSPTTCTITVNVQATRSGTFNNVTGTVSASSGTGNLTNATLTVAPLPPSAVEITKSFTPSTISAGGVATMSFVLSNLNASIATSGATVMFSDPFSNMRVTTSGTVVNTCGVSTVQFLAGTGVWSGTQGGAIGVRLSGTGSTSAVVPARVSATPGTCRIDVPVTSDTPGTLPNSTTGVTANVVTPGVTGSPSNVANLTVNAAAPSISKAFGVPSIPVGGVASMTFTVTNPNSVTLTGMSFTDGLTNMQLAAVPNVRGTCASVSSTASGGNTSFTVTGGDIPGGGSCSVTVDVTSSSVSPALGWPNFASGVTTTQTPTAGSQSNVAYLIVYSAGVLVSGRVYVDSNDNGVLDLGAPGETWATGVNVFVNLVGTGGLVVQSVALTPGTGDFTFNNVDPGNYQIVVTNSAINAVAVAPTAWFFRAPASGGYATVSIGLVPSSNWNIGLRSGALISGKVFRDTGGAGATANDGVLQGVEAPANPQQPANLGQGIQGVTVQLTNCAATIYATTTTDVSGDYRFAVPAGPPALLCVIETNPQGHLSTGGSAGATQLISDIPNSGYTYCRTATGTTCASRPADSISFAPAANTSYQSLNFGDVPINRFTADQTKQAPPGEVVFYPHTYVPGSVGGVVFSVNAVARPNMTGWGEVIYRDSNCNGTIDPAETALVIGGSGVAGSTVLLDPNDTIAGDPSGRRLCIIVKESIPPSAPFGAQNQATVTGTFSYTNSLPALSTTLTVVDTTLSGSATGGDGLRLQKEVCNLDNAAANPGGAACVASSGAGFGTNNSGKVGDRLQYRISYTNASSERLTSLVIRDSTPPFTVRTNNGSAPDIPAFNTTPGGLVTGALTDPGAGASGAFVWNFSGQLNPQATGIVTFTVTIQ